MRKIKLFPVGEKFNPWAVYESDLSQDAKSVYTMYHLNPSKLVPTNEETKQYTGIKSTHKMRAAVKELEIRGAIIFPGGNGKELVIRDAVNPKPEAPIMKLTPEEQPNVQSSDTEVVRVFYMSQYMISTGERYPWMFGKDNKAAQLLIKNYGLEGAKAKIKAAFDSQDEFYRKNARSLMGIVSIASRLIQQQIQAITQPGKWEEHESKQIKLNGRRNQ